MTLKERLEIALRSAKELGEKEELTAEEEVRFNGAVEEADKVKELIDNKEARSAKLATMATVARETEARLNKPASKPADSSNANISVTQEDRANPFETKADFLRAVMRAAKTHEVDPRLKEIRAAQGANEAVNSAGGYLVQQDQAKEIYESAREINSHVLSRVDLISVAGNGLKIPTVAETTYANGVIAGGVLGYWGAEAAALTKSQPVFGELDLSLNKVHALVYATDEILEDAGALESFISKKAPQAINWKVEDAIINGSGTGEPEGLLNSGGLITVAKETSQVAATVVVENIFKMYSRMKPSSILNAVWFISQDILPQLFGMTVGDQPVFIPGGVVANAPFGMLLGRPILPIEYCATLGTVGDIVFADLSDYAAIDKGGIKAAVSVHVEFLTDQTAFRYTYRFDGKHKMASDITPANGGPTISSAIALATRA